MSWRIHVFGVRHLSPMGAWQLREFLQRLRPERILIEGLNDATPLLPDITRKESKPPLAILAYTADLPVRTLVYPFARYSPEYEAIRWAFEHDVAVEFFDLPSNIFLGLQEAELSYQECLRNQPNPDPSESDSPRRGAEAAAKPANMETARLERKSLYEQVATLAGERDYDTYWERRFEHNATPNFYFHAAYALGAAIRELEEDHPRWRAENLVREAYMRRRIVETIQSGISCEKIVAVCGAFHAPVLTDAFPAMSDAELESLPRRESKLTLMPYSYFKLSSISGYGAGNIAPAYFELLWQSLQDHGVTDLSKRYLSLVARHLRDAGTHRSTAEVIEAVRLAETLSAFKEGNAPTLADLRDAAVTLLGQGEMAGIANALAQVDVGTEIGQLPKGVSQTSIQEDFDRELHRLKLEKYRTAVAQNLDLDLRENRHVKTEEAALLDLNRSTFFHRLKALEIPFAKPARTRQESATWAENWTLQWSPESEIALVEAVLLGETVEVAAAYKIKQLLEQCKRIDEAAAMVDHSVQCGLLRSMELARQRLQELAVSSSDFVSLALAASRLRNVIHYGDVRRFDAEPLVPLLQELFVQGALALFASAHCDDKGVRDMLMGMDVLNKVALEMHDRVEEALWLDQLRRLADADDRNPQLSGYACALLLERGILENEDLAREVSRRLSPGVPSELGAGWFEGLAQRNRYALLARQSLWEMLAEYIAALEEDEFRRALVFLRRSFGAFSPREKRSITENLAELWGLNKDATSELLEAPLSEEEEQKLQSLEEFGFDDL